MDTTQDSTYLKLQLAILIVLSIITRILYLSHKITTRHTECSTEKRTKPMKTMICIGSGGHTTEMLTLLKTLDVKNYFPRFYIYAKSDTTSLAKIKQQEGRNEYRTVPIPRSRTVGQSYFTSVLTTLYSTLYCIPTVAIIRPDLIICNGPGTCVPICITAFLLKVAFVCDTRIVFVESFCRTRSLSLTGKILIYFADNMLVQWPTLKRKFKRVTYIGKLM